MNKKTVVIGASPNPVRYSNIATLRLQKHEIEVVPLGIRKGEIGGLPIVLNKEPIPDIHTVTLYIGPGIQEEWKDYIYSLNPSRIIFNPGTENEDFENEAKEKGIEATRACTLVLLSIGKY